MSKSFSFVCVLAIIFCLCGCQAIPTDNKVRIIGIIDACKCDKQKMPQYLKYKVQKKEISEIVSFTIQECLKDE